MNVYVAVILDQNANIIATWSAYADNIRQCKQLFDEWYGPLKAGYKVLFSRVKEN